MKLFICALILTAILCSLVPLKAGLNAWSSGDETISVGRLNVGWIRSTNANRIYSFGDYNFEGCTFGTSQDLYSFGQLAGTNSTVLASQRLYLFGAQAGYIMGMSNISSMYAIGGFANGGLLATNVNESYTFGDSGKQNSTIIGGSQFYDIGDSTGVSMTLTNSQDIFNIGTGCGSSLGATNATFVYNYGHGSGNASLITNSADIYNYGLGAGASMLLTNVQDVNHIGSSAGVSASMQRSSHIYNFGYLAGNAEIVTNSDNIVGIGYRALDTGTFKNSTKVLGLNGGFDACSVNGLNNVTAIGQGAGHFLVGALTNVILMGAGSIAPTATANQVILGPNMTLSVPSNIVANLTISTNGFLGSYPLLAKTTNYTLLSTESRRLLSNFGTSALVTNTLPSAAAGLAYSFMVEATNGIQIKAAANNTIQIATTQSAAAGFIVCTNIGNTITLVCGSSGTNWMAMSHEGTWTFGP